MPASTRLAAVVVAAIAVGTTALAGCSDLSDDEQRAADNLAPALVQPQGGEAERDASGCVAETWVGEVGTDALVAEQLLARNLDVRREKVRALLSGDRTTSREVARGLASARLDCADFDAISLDQERDHPKASAKDLDDYADCLKGLDTDEWRASLVAFYAGTKPIGTGGFRQDLAACTRILTATDR
ncbi:hypothetical protein EKO23_22670 [Nocardioides guangzhouensis]|uniref:Lipoprotein n=1 Tax=Nocardioides guangzhouensis TaxID=2497878 RepID=A0A4Q4Z326_9ACTN|nr:hypothetical protein [Nocardioides guangzhouensis]RYP82057.1 hypothetical protein EKO23_22670 [Nocardioides guangzhouensis]